MRYENENPAYKTAEDFYVAKHVVGIILKHFYLFKREDVLFLLI